MSAASAVWYRWSSWQDDEDSLIPFFVPLTFWIAAYLYCRFYMKHEFARWDAIHMVHHATAMFLATLSLWNNDNKNNNNNMMSMMNIREHVPILWSLSYFSMDAMDCILRRDVEYILHASICLILGVANYNLVDFYQLKMNSKATFCELSTPLLHLAKRTKKSTHFILFALVFTCCRIVWIPILYQQLINHGIRMYHPMMIVLTGFYALNVVWYYKVLRIIYKGIVGDRDRHGGNGKVTTKNQ